MAGFVFFAATAGAGVVATDLLLYLDGCGLLLCGSAVSEVFLARGAHA